MAVTQLSDVKFNATVYASYVAEEAPERNAFYLSGVVVDNPLLTERAQGPSNITDLPFWKDLDQTIEPNLSTDDPSDVAAPQKIGTGKMIGRNAYLNQGWSSADLVKQLNGPDPMRQIAQRTSTYWRRQWSRRLIQSTLGIRDDNVANNSGDMVVDVASESIAGQSAATKFNFGSFVDAVSTMSESAEDLAAIAVHPQVMAQMRKNQEIDFIQDASTGLMIPTYNGIRVIEDKTLTVEAGATDGFKYTSILFGNAAFGMGEGMPRTPVAIEREEAQGNGEGIETLWERKTMLLHPLGFQFTSASVAGQSATLAELANAANWSRVFERENVPMAFMVTN